MKARIVPGLAVSSKEVALGADDTCQQDKRVFRGADCSMPQINAECSLRSLDIVQRVDAKEVRDGLVKKQVQAC